MNSEQHYILDGGRGGVPLVGQKSIHDVPYHCDNGKGFCSHRTGNARLLRPLCLRRTESHAENPIAKARSTYWCRAFNVRSPCHWPRVRTAVCVSVPQWDGAGALKAPLTCVVLWPAYFLLKLMGRPLPFAPFERPYPLFWVPSPRWADDNAWDYIF